jgi:hypothetical protein
MPQGLRGLKVALGSPKLPKGLMMKHSELTLLKS